VPVALAGIEDIRDEQSADLLQCLGKWTAQGLRARRQLHAGADADEQGIAENITEPAQRVARRRLRQADPHRGSADIAFQQQCIERDKQIEIQRG
jgi:hypothetical protein